MTVTPAPASELESALSGSQAAAWEVRCEAASRLVEFSDVRAQDRLVEMLSDPGNIAVIETAAKSLVLGRGHRGLRRVVEAFDTLDEQAATYAAVAVSDALGDDVFERLLDVITGTDDERVRSNARRLGAQIGMTTSPQWDLAFPSLADAPGGVGRPRC